MFARVDENNFVVELWDVPTLPPLHPAAAALYYPCPESTQIGWVMDTSGNFAPYVPPLADAKSAKQQELRAAAKAAITGGVQSSVLGSAHTYPTSETDQQNLTGLVLEANIDGVGGKFWCADSAGVWARRDHTASQIIQLGREVAAHVKTQQDKYEQLIQQVEAATTVPDVEAIVW